MTFFFRRGVIFAVLATHFCSLCTAMLINSKDFDQAKGVVRDIKEIDKQTNKEIERKNDRGFSLQNRIGSSIQTGPVAATGTINKNDNKMQSTMSVLSLNVFILPPLATCPERGDRLELLGAKLAQKEHDIVLLQEVFGTFDFGRRTDFVNDMKDQDHGYYQSVMSPQPGFINGIVDGGLMILSRFPVLKTNYLVFEDGRSSDFVAAKGVQYVLIDRSPADVIHVFNTHLQASYAPADQEPETRATRRKQIGELVEFIQESISESDHPTAPILLGGDFNINSLAENSEEYDHLVQQLSEIGEVHDLILEGNEKKQHPVTYKNTSQQPKEILLTQDQSTNFETNASYDYIFSITPRNANKIHQGVTTIINVDKAYADPLLVDKENPLFVKKKITQISDHSAVVAKIHLIANN